ncbi:MAG: hypothetical protein HZB17_14430, partial [Chloroflexi bacterium]|nr:hypothetical protein [Chloroflexota bacterium]
MSPKLLRLIFNLLIAFTLIFSSVGSAAAGPGCPPGQQISYTVVGGPPGAKINVQTNDGNYPFTLDNNGNGSIVLQGSQYTDVRIYGGAKEMKVIPGCVGGKETGPSGNQGQTTPSSTNTSGNTPNSGTMGDPINSATGEYFFDLPLIDLGGA